MGYRKKYEKLVELIGQEAATLDMMQQLGNAMSGNAEQARILRGYLAKAAKA